MCVCSALTTMVLSYTRAYSTCYTHCTCKCDLYPVPNAVIVVSQYMYVCMHALSFMIYCTCTTHSTHCDKQDVYCRHVCVDSYAGPGVKSTVAVSACLLLRHS